MLIENNTSTSQPNRLDGMAAIHVVRTPPKPSVVYDTYWKFAAERQNVYFRRLGDTEGPWTDDPILSEFKFTNPYRAADRTSQYLIQKVIYASNTDLRNTVFRILLFKIFNKVETWKLLESRVENLDISTFDVTTFDQVLEHARQNKTSIYSAAYIMPSGAATNRLARKHQMHLRLLADILADGLPEKLAGARTMQEAYNLLLALPSIGPFLAYQFVTDLNYSDHFAYSEMEFVMPGPGAKDGIKKAFVSPGDYSDADIIRWVTERQEEEIRKRDLDFRTLWGRPLQLIDCQNLFCECDKYARVAHPEVSGFSGRSKIKQRFAPAAAEPLRPWFPPKWKLNTNIPCATL